MEKELGVPKPGDLLIGVIDFFAVLVPGIIAAALIVKATRATPQVDTFFVSGLVIAGWVLGHVLHGLGSFLDPLLYDPLFKPLDVTHSEPVGKAPGPRAHRLRAAIEQYLHKNDSLYQLANELTDVPERQDWPTGAAGVPGGIYQWARAWLSSHSPEANASLDRLEADSKLFRSLAVLFLIVIPILIAIPALIEIPRRCDLPAHPRWPLIVFAFAGVVFSLWRYCDLRNKMIRLCYIHYLQLRFESRTHRQT